MATYTKNKPANKVTTTFKDTYQEVTDAVIQALEEGTVIWQCPWNSAGLPKNITPGIQYRGWNLLWLNFLKASKDNLEIEGHLLKLNALDPMLAQDALHYCYSENYKSFNDFKKRFPVNIDLDVSRFLEGQYAWCEYAGVSETPTLYLNGQKLPNHYQLEDIKYFI